MVHCGIVYQKKFAGVQNIGQQVSHSTKFYTVTNFLWWFLFPRRCVAKKKFHYYYLPASQAWYNQPHKKRI